MKALWLFILLIVFCIYVLFGLYLTESAETFLQILLTWVIYTILWTTFINVFLLGYFWSVVRTKTGPYGIRGPSGERGNDGIQGKCSIDAGQAYCIKAISEYIDGLYKEKTNKSILDEESQTFPNTYLTKKISIMAGSRQYQVILANLSGDNKPVMNIINYLKSIWKQWFDLLYKATPVKGVWFTDEFADDNDNYTWIGGINPFVEIKKYDIFYWGITRDFRPLKAEICRTSPAYNSSKFPMPNKPQTPDSARLKIIQTNDYYYGAYDRHSGASGNAGFWQPHLVTIGDDTYYPLGSVMTASDNDSLAWYAKHNYIIKGNPNTAIFAYTQENTPGPDMRTALVAGDVKSPAYFRNINGWGGDDDMISFTPVCPDGYTDLGDVMGRWGGFMNPETVNIKCVPTDCVEQVYGNLQYPWGGQANGDINVLNTFNSGQQDANGDNGYNLVRLSSGKPFYRIKESCLNPKPLLNSSTVTKDVEERHSDKGIGWYGHPYKLDPKYSIFTFLNLVPEGMIVHQQTGRRYYIVHYGKEEQNIYNVLDFNESTKKYDNALEADSNKYSPAVYSAQLDKTQTNTRQHWVIVLQSDTTILKLKSLFNGNYLCVLLNPTSGIAQFTTTDANTNSADQTFTFISSFGTQLDVIGKKNVKK